MQSRFERYWKSKKHRNYITFSSKQPINLGQHRQYNIAKEPLGVRGVANNVKTELEAFSLFITDVKLEKIKDYKNKNI